jgi:hypothetical protein
MFVTIHELLNAIQVNESRYSDMVEQWCSTNLESFKTATDAYLALRKYVDETSVLKNYLTATFKGSEVRIQRYLIDILSQMAKEKNLSGYGEVDLTQANYNHSASGSASASM